MLNEVIYVFQQLDGTICACLAPSRAPHVQSRRDHYRGGMERASAKSLSNFPFAISADEDLEAASRILLRCGLSVKFFGVNLNREASFSFAAK